MRIYKLPEEEELYLFKTKVGKIAAAHYVKPLGSELDLIEHGTYSVYSMGIWFDSIEIRREYPIYTSRMNSIKAKIDQVVRTKVYPLVDLLQEGKGIHYQDILYLDKYTRDVVICEFKPELNSISQLIGQLNVYNDYLRKETNLVSWDVLTRTVVTYDLNTDFDDMLNEEGISIFRIPKG